MYVACSLLDLSNVLCRIFLEFSSAIITTESNGVSFLRIDRSTAEWTLVVYSFAGDFHLLDKVVGVLFKFALTVVAAEANKVAFVAGCGLDGITAEWACVVDRCGFHLGNRSSRIFCEFTLAITTAESYRVGGILFDSITTKWAFFIDRASDDTDNGCQTQATQKGSEPFH